MMLDVYVLGPVEVYQENERVHLARRQQRLIVGILALEANREVTCDRLIDLLWGHSAPRNARAVVQSRISEVRAILNRDGSEGGAHILSRGNSYVLDIPAERVDAHHFRKLVTGHRAKPAEQARLALREALGLWRGPVLGTRSDDEALGEVCQGLESARLTAWEELFEVELRLGRHHEIVDELVEMAARNRARERLMEHMMLALHRTGRSIEALKAYDRWRRWLREDLGADPGDQLRALHLAVLNNDPAITIAPAVYRQRADGGDDGAFVAAVPRILPPAIVDFTGRDHEMELICSALVDGGPSERRLVAVSGPPGVGKTALAIQVAHKVKDQFPDGQLYVNLLGTDFDEPTEPIDVLGRFLRSFGVDGQALPATLNERIDLYRDLVAERKVLVVLDNAAGDHQVQPLIPGGQHCAVLTTGRTRLGVTLGASTVSLESLDPEKAQDLLSCVVGASRVAAEPPAAAELVKLCGYLPLAIRVVGARLAAKPHWTVDKMVKLCSDEQSRLDQLAYKHLDVRSSIGLSYSGLPDDAGRLLRLLGHIGLPDATVWVSTALLSVATPAADAALEHLFDAHLVEVTGRDAAGYPRYRMHDLVRLFARERASNEEAPADLDSASKRAFRLCLTLAEHQHLALNTGSGQNIRGSTQRWAASDDLIGELTAQPMRWFDHERHTIAAMIQRAARDGASSLCWELASAVSPLFQMRQDFGELDILLNVALQSAKEAADEHGRGAMLCRLGLNHIDRSEADRGRELLVQASAIFDRTGDQRSQGTMKSLIATIDRFEGDHGRTLEKYQEALAMLRSANDEAGVAWCLRGIGQLHMDRKEYDKARNYIELSLKKYITARARRGEAAALFWLSMVYLKQGQHVKALRGFQESLDIARSITDHEGEAQCLRGIGMAYQELGQTDEARNVLLEALNLVRQPRPTLIEGHIRRTLANL